MNKYIKIIIFLLFLSATSCKVLSPVEKVKKPVVPESFAVSKDSTNSAKIVWKDFFVDKNLNNLIDIGIRLFRFLSTKKSFQIIFAEFVLSFETANDSGTTGFSTFSTGARTLQFVAEKKSKKIIILKYLFI